MKKLLTAFVTGALLIPLFAFATPTTWDYTTNLLQPLQSMWGAQVKVPYITATSTTQQNNLPLLLSTTATTTNLAVTTRANFFGTIGTALSDFCVAITGGSGLCDGSDANSGGTVTSVDMSVPTGLSIANNPITNSGTLALTLTSGYAIPSTTRLSNHDTAFGWGNHAIQGYITDGNTGWDNSYGFVTEGQTVGTTSAGVAGQAAYWTGIRTLAPVATGTLTENALGLEFDNSTRGLFGGSAALSLTSGYAIPSTTRLVDHDTAFSWGNHAVAGYDQVTTAGDGLTRTVNDFDCDIATSGVFGCISTTDWNAFDDKVSSTSIDTSSELAALLTDEVGSAGGGSAVFNRAPSFTGTSAFNALTVSATATLASATTTNLGVVTGIDLFGGGYKTSANALCIQLTGSADLCDGVDGGGSGGGSNWYYDGTRLTPTTTTAGIVINASSTIDALSTRLSTSTHATATNIYVSSTFSGAGLATCSDGVTSKLLWNATTRQFSCGTDQSGGGGGAMGGWATTTNGNPEAAEAVTYTSTDVYIGGSTSSSTAFSFDPEASRFTLSSTTANATGTILSTSGAVIFGTSTESVEFNFNTANTLKLFTSTGVSLFDFGSIGVSTTNATATTFAASTICLSGDCKSAWPTGGGGSSNWNQAFAGMLAPSTTIGIRVAASSTFLGAVMIASTSPDYTNTIFEVATSSPTSGDLFSIKATSSLLSNTSSLSGLLADNGTRISIGQHEYMGLPGLLDQLVIHGRMRNPDWFQADCPISSGATAITSDTAAATGIVLCGDYDFYEDNTATLTSLSGSGFHYGQLGTAAANDGAGVFLRGLTGGFLIAATSTPSMEVTARIGTIAALSSTTSYYIGYTNLAVAGTTYETEPTAGCYFVASTTQANWRAICKTANANTTNVDTGVASTTNGVVAGGGGKFRTFRIDMDSNNAEFYIANGNTTALTKVADISTNYPSTNVLNAGIHMGRTTGTQALQFDFFGLNVWWRRFTPNN